MKRLSDLTDEDRATLNKLGLLDILYSKPSEPKNDLRCDDLRDNYNHKYFDPKYFNKNSSGLKLIKYKLYYLSMEIQFGNIEYVHMSPVDIDKSGINHNIEYIGMDKFTYANEPIVFGKIKRVSWSHGCAGYNSYLFSGDYSTIDELKFDASEVIDTMIDDYKVTVLDQEMERYNKAVKLVKELRG